MTTSKHLATQLIHGEKDLPRISPSVVADLVLSTTFERNESGEVSDGADIYTRSSNPNRRMLEQKLALLEDGSVAFAFASGQAATMCVFHVVGGRHIIIPDDMYYNGRFLLERCYPNRNLRFSVVDMTDLQAIENAITDETALIWLETPSNPLLKVADIKAVTDLAKKHGVLTACDNTWATPFHTKPFEFGVDIVMHSTTKYMGGHSDILGGCIILNEHSEKYAASILDFQQLGGGVPSPFDCWLLNRSLSTFAVRMPVHATNAQTLALFLEQHPLIEKVNYPGLASNQYHSIATQQMVNGFGGMLSIEVKRSEQQTKELASSLKLFRHATSLGGVESLIEHRRSVEGKHPTSPANLLRISVGIEHIDDLIADLDAALAR